MQGALLSYPNQGFEEGKDERKGRERHSNLERRGMFRDFNQFYAKHYRWRKAI
jgi:hypothetical protein